MVGEAVMGDGIVCCAGLHHQSQTGRPEHGAEGGLLWDPGLCFSKSTYTCLPELATLPKTHFYLRA